MVKKKKTARRKTPEPVKQDFIEVLPLNAASVISGYFPCRKKTMTVIGETDEFYIFKDADGKRGVTEKANCSVVAIAVLC